MHAGEYCPAVHLLPPSIHHLVCSHIIVSQPTAAILHCLPNYTGYYPVINRSVKIRYRKHHQGLEHHHCQQYHQPVLTVCMIWKGIITSCMNCAYATEFTILNPFQQFWFSTRMCPLLGCFLFTSVPSMMKTLFFQCALKSHSITQQNDTVNSDLEQASENPLMALKNK